MPELLSWEGCGVLVQAQQGPCSTHCRLQRAPKSPGWAENPMGHGVRDPFTLFSFSFRQIIIFIVTSLFHTLCADGLSAGFLSETRLMQEACPPACASSSVPRWQLLNPVAPFHWSWQRCRGFRVIKFPQVGWKSSARGKRPALKLLEWQSRAEFNLCSFCKAAARPNQTAHVISKASGGRGKKLKVYREEVSKYRTRVLLL